MFATTQDILNIALAGGFILLVIFICVVSIYLIMILRDISRVTAHAKDTAQKVNDLILKPFKLVSSLASKAQPILEIVEEKIKEKTKKSSRKKS